MKYHVAIGVGGNIGDSRRIFAEALKMLAEGGVGDLKMASFIVTKPVDCVPGTPDFMNTAVTGDWCGTPLELLALTQSIERAMGRPVAHSSHESRTLDLDILLMDGLTVDEPTLTIPHPRMCERRFVLKPLAELESDWLIPGVGKTVGECLEQLNHANCREDHCDASV